MPTDWNQVRSLIGAAIDACETYENLEPKEEDREIELSVGEVKVFELVTSAYTFAENTRYSIIRTRHRGGFDNRYVPEAARILRAVTHAAIELIGAAPGMTNGRASPSLQEKESRQELKTQVDAMISWYRDFFAVELRRALEKRAKPVLN
ncbi:hypothetical protein [Burkholderia ambifaria]|jgi:hypothetical protein|uniref:hypothetical protein n=1 Tax=Burkholderia ambifaria TaxID=152480 RepID=UPI000D00CF72|nr:hypothetical protein [Burkholderia ambifaria]PRG00288.1 hypothetical protein C6Q14_21990 [Burkholderia ambifaria]QQJ96442.1 hypothetical protein JG536_12570 [Burkholderia ambifaria]